MNELEQSVKRGYERRGYDVITKGIPDLILLKDGVISFVEVKNKRDQISDAQFETIEKLRKHKFRVTFKGDGALRNRRKYLLLKYGWCPSRSLVTSKMITEDDQRRREEEEAKRLINQTNDFWSPIPTQGE